MRCPKTISGEHIFFDKEIKISIDTKKDFEVCIACGIINDKK